LVFQEENAAQRINSMFVPFKVDKNDSNYKELASRYNMRGFPTVIILSPDGTERDRIVGFGGDAELFVQTITDYANNVNTLVALKEAYEQNPQSVNANFNLAMKYLDRFQVRKAQDYFERVLELDPQNEFGYNQKAEFNIALNQARYDENVQPLKEMLNEVSDRGMLKTGYYTLAGVYEDNGELEKMVSTYKQALEIFDQDAGMMNTAAWIIYEKRLKDHYEWGIQVAKKAVELEPENDSIWDTLAWLQYENGEINAALASMQKAVELSPDTEYYQQNVKKFKAELE